VGGYARHAVRDAAIVAALAAWLPLHVALGLTAAGVLATLVLEVPPFVRVLRGAAYVSDAPAVAARRQRAGAA
jgi:hypothetical protein